MYLKQKIERTCWVWSGEVVLSVPGRLSEWEGKQVMWAGGKGMGKVLWRNSEQPLAVGTVTGWAAGTPFEMEGQHLRV